jgi:uncharacterized Zn finger protein
MICPCCNEDSTQILRDEPNETLVKCLMCGCEWMVMILKQGRMSWEQSKKSI